MNILKSPEQYALLLIDACDGRAFDAVDLLKIAANAKPSLPKSYVADCLEVIRKYCVEDWRPAPGHYLTTP